jgi:lipopolysaccharide/colanic/teichoic acid biosynthesis glycosyltransferase
VVAKFRREIIWQATHAKYQELFARRAAPASWIKRAFDVAVSATSLVALSPVIAASALAIRMTMGAPVLFRHDRPGKDGKLFTLYKFRTMRQPKPGERVWYRTDEERLTKLGQFLRNTNLDELPQLINVLRGDISVIGPRPLLEEYLARYTPEQARRHAVRPGITGWAQVHGRRTLKFSKRIEYDLWYIDHWSLWLDLKILALTVKSLFEDEGMIYGQTPEDVDDLGLVPDRRAEH